VHFRPYDCILLTTVNTIKLKNLRLSTVLLVFLCTKGRIY